MGGLECVITGLMDEFSVYFRNRKYAREIFTLVIIITSFSVALINVTPVSTEVSWKILNLVMFIDDKTLLALLIISISMIPTKQLFPERKQFFGLQGRTIEDFFLSQTISYIHSNLATKKCLHRNIHIPSNKERPNKQRTLNMNQ